MAGKNRSRKQKQDLPYGCGVSKCNQHFKTTAQLFKHYKQEHPDAVITKHEDGTFTVDLRKMTKVKKGATKSVAMKQAGKEAAKKAVAKISEPKPEVPKAADLTSWKQLTEAKQNKILEFVKSGIADESLTWSGTRKAIALKFKVNVWPYTVRQKLDSDFDAMRKARIAELRAEKKVVKNNDKPVEVTA